MRRLLESSDAAEEEQSARSRLCGEATGGSCCGIGIEASSALAMLWEEAEDTAAVDDRLEYFRLLCGAGGAYTLISCYCE